MKLAMIGLGIRARSVEEVVRKLELSRVVWLMIPVGTPVEETKLSLHRLRPPRP